MYYVKVNYKYSEEVSVREVPSYEEAVSIALRICALNMVDKPQRKLFSREAVGLEGAGYAVIDSDASREEVIALGIEPYVDVKVE